MRNKFYLLPVAFILISLNAYPQTQTFTEIPANIPGYSHGATDWGDYDNDGDLDVLICGLNNSGIPESAVFRNNGNNTFSRITSIILTGLYYSDCTWQDYDIDGDLDIMLSGRDQNSLPSTMIYRNNGTNSFSLQRGINL